MKDSNGEDDAALVDSFFLPGGLFADEANNNAHDDSNDDDNSLRRLDSIPGRTMLHTPAVSSQLPQNPWETNNQKVATNAGQALGSSAMLSSGMDVSSRIPLHLSMSATNSNNGHELQHLGHDRNDANGRYQADNRQGAMFENSLLPQNQAGIFQQGARVKFKERNETQKIVRPPPGFQTSPNVVSSTFATNSRHPQDQIPVRNITNNNNPDSLEFLTTNNKNNIITGETIYESKNDVPFLASNLLYPTRNDTPSRTPLHHQDFTIQPPTNTIPLVESRSPQPYVPSNNKRNNKSNNNNNGWQQGNKNKSKNNRARYVQQPTPPNIESNTDREAHRMETENMVTLSPTESIAAISNDFIVEAEDDGLGERCEDDNDEEDDEEEEEDITTEEENSIPSSIGGSSGLVSNASSLSTSSGVDNNSDVSSQVSGADNHHHNSNRSLDFKDEGVGYDTDQAHVSQIDEMLGNSTADGTPGTKTDEQLSNDEDDDAESSSPVASGNSLNEKLPRASSAIGKPHDCKQDSREPTLSFPQRFLELLHGIIQNSVETCQSAVHPALSAIHGSSLAAMASERRDQLAHQRNKLSQEWQKFAKWLIDITEVFGVLSKQILMVGRRALRAGTMGLLILVSASFELLKFSIIEAVEEFKAVTMCYLVFYKLPTWCDFLMDHITLPHWTPHVVTWMAIYSLCQTVDDGPFYDTNGVPILTLLEKICTPSSSPEIPAADANNGVSFPSSKPTTPKNSVLHRELQHHEISRLRDKQLSYIALKILKTAIPVFFVVEGFSSECGALIGLRGASRLLTAFDMCLVRKCIVKNPIGWVSWSIQVLLATYLHSWVLLDYFLILIGFSSIRLIRYLELQRLRARKSTKTK